MNTKILLSLSGLFFLSGTILPAVPAASSALEKKIPALVEGITPSLIATRRNIHQHPELPYQEIQTSRLVAERLAELGLEVRTGIAGTGVLGILRGGKPGPVVALRADMDALPITEETGLPFASREKGEVDGRPCGIMHACGHDIHTTVMLGVAEVLSRLRKDLPGTVLFVAQPSEEGESGAERMLREGVFRDIKPRAMFAFHVHDMIKAGTVSYVPGFATANVDSFRLTIKSQGCHGSTPYLCVDPITVGAQIVLALQVMIGREIPVDDNTVITVGAFNAGSVSNVIPDKAVLQATIRTYGQDQRRAVKEKIERLIAGQCQAAKATYDLDYHFGTMSLYNDPALMDRIFPTVARSLGGSAFLKQDPPEMGGEDFAFFAKEVPSVMLNLGVVTKDMEKTAVHSPTFVADEAAIPVGVRTMASIIVDFLFDPRLKPAGK